MNWRDYASIVGAGFSFVLIVLVQVSGSSVVEIKNNVCDIKSQIFTHLTNHELHTPRTVVEEQLRDKVSNEQFVIYQTMRDRQMSDLKDAIMRIENKIDKLPWKERP